MKKSILLVLTFLCIHSSYVAFGFQVEGPGKSRPGKGSNTYNENANKNNGYDKPPYQTGHNKNQPSVPIDGGLSVLLAAGIGLGAAKVFKKKKEEECGE